MKRKLGVDVNFFICSTLNKDT